MQDYLLGCDGNGITKPERVIQPNRRGFLSFAMGGLGLLSARAGLTDVVIGKEPGNILLVVFMRGGADGLSLVAPTFEDNYHRARPSLRLAAANDAMNVGRQGLALDDRFVINKAMPQLHRLFAEGKLGIVHAAGSGDQTRSHFEAMAVMERGLNGGETGLGSGWIARHLADVPARTKSPLRAVAFGPQIPDSLRGATSATAINSLTDYRLLMPNGWNESRFHDSLAKLYSRGNDEISKAGTETLGVLKTLQKADPNGHSPAKGVEYPKSDFGEVMRQVASLIRCNVGLEIACVDHRGPYLWDTHVAQETVFAAQAGDLSAGIGAFVTDMGEEMKRITVIAMTEFGRRLHENTGLGTDHGRGGVMFLTGGGVIGGKLHGKWPGLNDSQLEEPGDLRAVNDYRAVLAEVLQKRMGNPNARSIFPELTSEPLRVLNS